MTKPRGLRPLSACCLAALSAGMLVLALPGYEQWYLSFVALVPMLVAIQRASTRAALMSAWLAGGIFFLLGLLWLAHLTVIGLVMLAFYLSLSFLAFAAVVRWVTGPGRARLPFLVAAPVAWVALEHVRGLPLGGFFWHCLGHNLYRQTAFIQVADLAGVAGVSLVVACVNVLIARAIHLALSRELGGRLARRHLGFAAAAVAALVAGTILYGARRLAETRAVAGPVVSVVQGNIPQELDEVEAAMDWTMAQRLARRDSVFDAYRALTLDRLAGVRDDLVVWPETMVSPLEGETYDDTPNGDCSTLVERKVRALCARLGRPMLVGSTRLARDADNVLCSYNGAYFFGDARSRFQACFKIVLVPFSEYVPFRNVPGIKAFIEWFMPPGYVAELSAGKEIVLFAVKGVPFAAPICYEDTYPSLVREYRRRGARFLVNLTNDGWFRETVELDQHLANAAFRTVENRIGLVVAANTGISAFVSPTGVITARLEDSEGRFRAVAGTLTRAVMLDERETIYTRIGDALAWMATAVAALACAGRIAERIGRRRRDATPSGAKG